jgi:hypothetical protein
VEPLPLALRGGRGGLPTEAEFGGPLWQLGTRWYELLDAGRAVGALTRDGISTLALVDLASGQARALDLPSWSTPGLVAAAVACWSRR